MLEEIITLTGHKEDRIWHASWSKSGLYLATCGEDRSIRIWSSFNRLWDDASIKCIATLEDGQSRTLRCCEWSNDERMIVSASFDGTVVVWESQNAGHTNWEMVSSLEGHENEVKCVCWSHDDRWIASCGRDKTVWIWENEGKGDFECVTVLQGHTQDVKSVLFHPTLPMLFSASYDNLIKVWKEEGDEWYCAETLSGHSSTVWSLTLNSEGDKMVSGSSDLSIIFWEMQHVGNNKYKWLKSATLQNIHRFPIYSVNWNHLSNYIVSAGGDDAIVLYRHVAGSDGPLQLESKLEEAHMNDINSCRWNPNPQFSDVLVTTGDDSCIKLWRLVL